MTNGVRGPVLHIDDLDLQKTTDHGSVIEATSAQFAAPLGASHLGGRLVELAPGKRAWPRHNHHNNDEMFFILSGEGTLRFGEDSYPVGPGDLAVCPAGGQETAHQMINSGAQPLRYLAISSMREPDIMEYPDSGKWGAFAGSAPGGDPARRTFSGYAWLEPKVGYFEGEPED